MRKVAFLLSLALIFCIPWENAISVAGLGTMTRMIGMATSTIWLGSILVTGKLRKPHLFHWLVFLVILWNVMSFFWSVDMDETQMRVITYIQLGLLSWILWDLYTTQQALRFALQAYILGAYIAIGGTFSNFFTGQVISVYSGSRFSGVGMDANDLALILILGLPVAWYLINIRNEGFKVSIPWLVNFTYMPLACFAILLTASRTAIFAVVPAIVYILVTTFQLKLRTRIFFLVIFIVTFVTLQIYIPQTNIARLSSVPTSIALGDFGGRVALWRASIKLFFEHPVLGIGSGALNSPIQLGAYAHNTFLSVLAELGLIGIILFAALLSITLHEAIKQPISLSVLWIVVLSVWVIGVFTLTWEFRKPTWLFLNLVIVSASLSTGSVKQKVKDQFRTMSSLKRTDEGMVIPRMQ